MSGTFILSKKNQVTVPKWVRSVLHVKAHQSIEFKQEDNNKIIIKAAPKKTQKELFWEKMSHNTKKYGSDNTGEIYWGNDVGNEK